MSVPALGCGGSNKVVLEAGDGLSVVGDEGGVEPGLVELAGNERVGVADGEADADALGGVAAGGKGADAGGVDERHVEQVDDDAGGPEPGCVDQGVA